MSNGKELFETERASARRTYPMYAGESDAFVLAMVASNQRHAIRSRNEVLNLNAKQAVTIAGLMRALAEHEARGGATPCGC
jgi:hypothetical protein